VSLNELIKAHASADPTAAALAVFADLGCPPKWQEVFFSLVRHECRNQYRATVRDLEAEPTTVVTTSESKTDPSARSEFLTYHFYNGEKWVLWDTATVDDHEKRIAYQLTLRNGIDRDIEKHRWAIQQITAAGVTCLADLNEAAS